VIVGLAVKLPWYPCRQCGAAGATIISDHILQCVCGVERGQLSKATLNFVTSIVKHFGRPLEPIVISARAKKHAA
jgi:hypothetical protein